MIKRLLILFIAFNYTFLYANYDSNKTEDKSQKEYKLIIEGVKSLDKDDIAKALGVQSNSFFNFWSKDNMLKEEFIQNLKPTLKGYLENRGYFDSKVEIRQDKSSIKIYIQEGTPIKVSDIRIDSNFDIKKLITFKKGDIFVTYKFVDIKDKIINKLLENGYCKYKLDTKAFVDLKKHSAKLVYKLDKDGLCYFGDIKIIKHPKDISKDVILSRLQFKKGDRFNIQSIQDSYNNLNKLNTFANLQIKYSLKDSNHTINTEISANKREKLKRYMLAIGYDSLIGMRFKGSWEKRNFFGNAKKFTISTAIAKDNQKIEASLFSPAFLTVNKYYADFYLTSGYEREKTDAYKQKRFFINGYLNHISKSWDFKVGLGLENLKIDLYENLQYVIAGNFNLIYPYLNITYDTRDSKLDPKNGIYLSWYNEYGLASGTSGVQYLKYLFEARFIKSFGDLTLSAVGRIGAIHEVSGKLPASKLFYGGGVYSNRAYGKKELGIITSNKSYRKLGGKSYLNLQLEANYKIYKKLYGAIFFDSTLINEKEYNYKGDRIDTLGLGLRYKTPIGPVKIDVGFNIHNRKDYAISIMLGQSF